MALVFIVMAALPSSARAADPPAAPSSESTQRARVEFVAATDHVKNARWGEALAAFERSAEQRPHALTTFNIGACERALGRYTRARATLLRALAADTASGRHELPASFVNDAREWIREIDGMLVRASIVLNPADAALLVDGAPLMPSSEGPEYVAGTGRGAAGGQGPTSVTTLRDGRAAVVLDPGVHIFSLSRAGFASAVVTKTLAPGTRPEIALDMQSLPATLRIASNRTGSVVTVDGLDVGVTPVQLTRPAGTYAVIVRRVGFVTYQSKVKVGPGEEPTIQATLPEEKTPVTKQVWFWSAAAALVAGAVVGTWLLTRPEPERPAPNGGALGWVVTVPAGQ